LESWLALCPRAQNFMGPATDVEQKPVIPGAGLFASSPRAQEPASEC
jgi:hypothetical protein